MPEIPSLDDCTYLSQGCFSEAYRMPDGRVLLKTSKNDGCKAALSRLKGRSPHLPETTHLGEKDGYDYFVQPYYERVGSFAATVLAQEISFFLKENYGWARPTTIEMAANPPTKTTGLDQGIIDAIMLVAGEIEGDNRFMDFHFMNIGFTRDGTPILLDPIS